MESISDHLDAPDAAGDGTRRALTARPLLLAVYLLTVSAAAFAIPPAFRPQGVVFFIAYQLFLLALTRKLSRRTFFSLWKLKFLFLFLLLGYSLLPDGSTTPRWRPYPDSYVSVSFEGLGHALLLCGQISVVVLTSHLVCSVASPQMLAKGLQSLWISPMLAHALSTTLEQLQDTSGGMGSGRGMGGGRGMGRGRRQQLSETDAESLEQKPTLWQRLQKVPSIVRGQANPLGEKLRRQFSGDEDTPAPEGLSAQHAHDAKVIAGIAAVMLSLKAMKFLPGLPFASGHKAIVFIPLYLVAADRTRSRWGATAAGLVMGLVAFVGGDGRYGIFEVLKHVAPGICIDLLWPLVRRWQRRYTILTIVGIAAAMARVSTELALTWCLGLRWELYAFPVAKLFPNLVAGALSGLVSTPLLAYLANEPAKDEPEQLDGAPEPTLTEDAPPDDAMARGGGGGGRGGGGGGGRGGGRGRGQGGGQGRRRDEANLNSSDSMPERSITQESETTVSGEAENR